MKDIESGQTDYVVQGAKVLFDDGLHPADLRIEQGLIAEIGYVAAGNQTIIDGRGMILAPAMIDLHGDAFERQIMPRPNVFFPTEAAILDTDRQLAANGIATAYHALTLSWEPGLRSVGRGESFAAVLDALERRLTVDNRLQLRWETFAFEAIDFVLAMLDSPKTPSLAFNDHTSMSVRAFDVAIQDRAFEHGPDFSVAALDDPRMKQRTAGHAKRAGLSEEAYIALLAEVWERRPRVDEAIRRLASRAAERGVPILSHDDTRVETRDYYRGLGSRISEFPMTRPVAEAARAAGDAIVFGAPNAVRGGSHIGSPSAAEMIEAGLCDVLASDYFYPSMLQAVARLHDERRAPLPELWHQVSRNPARASGLSDRGTIAAGRRADLVLLDWPDSGVPAVRMTMSAGRIAYLGGDILR